MTFRPCFPKHLSTYSILNGLPERDPSSMNAGKYVGRAGVSNQKVPDGDCTCMYGGVSK